jgi:putative intracellular protease/amidase
MDKRSLDPGTVGEALAERMHAYLSQHRGRLEKPLVLAEIETDRYDAIIVPGGHGPIEDLYKDPDMGRVLIEADKHSKVIAAVCHGPAALLAARDENGRWPFAGRKMTSLTDEEEIEFGTAQNAPWLLADTLRKSGAAFEQGPNWSVYVVRDGNLLTGQNPQSSASLAEAVITALQ